MVETRHIRRENYRPTDVDRIVLPSERNMQRFADAGVFDGIDTILQDLATKGDPIVVPVHPFLIQEECIATGVRFDFQDETGENGELLRSCKTVMVYMFPNSDTVLIIGDRVNPVFSSEWKEDKAATSARMQEVYQRYPKREVWSEVGVED